WGRRRAEPHPRGNSRGLRGIRGEGGDRLVIPFAPELNARTRFSARGLVPTFVSPLDRADRTAGHAFRHQPPRLPPSRAARSWNWGISFEGRAFPNLPRGVRDAAQSTATRRARRRGQDQAGPIEEWGRSRNSERSHF